MNAVREVQNALNSLKIPHAFDGKFAIKLHGAHLLGTRASSSSVSRVEVAIQKKDEHDVHKVLVQNLGYTYISVKSSRRLLVYEKKGTSQIKLHLYEKMIPRHMTYNNKTHIVSLNELPKNDAKVKKMIAYINNIKRIGNLNSLD
jgi:hypothetical protein